MATKSQLLVSLPCSLESENGLCIEFIKSLIFQVDLCTVVLDEERIIVFDRFRKLYSHIRLESIVLVQNELYKHPLILDHQMPLLRIYFESHSTIRKENNLTGILHDLGTPKRISIDN